MGFCVLADKAAMRCHNVSRSCLSIHQPPQSMWVCRSQRKKILSACCRVGDVPWIVPIEPVVVACRGVCRVSKTATTVRARASTGRNLTSLLNLRQTEGPARRYALPMARNAPAAGLNMPGRAPPSPSASRAKASRMRSGNVATWRRL